MLLPTHLLLIVVYAWDTVVANEDAKRLYDDLLVNYNRHRRPAMAPAKAVNVKLKLRLSQIIDLHEIDQIMTVGVCNRSQLIDS